jgi:galactonate dehydratase
MKIISVDVMELKPRNNPIWRPIICRINTDEGRYGYGEAAMAYGGGASAAFGMIKDLAKLIIEMDPTESIAAFPKNRCFSELRWCLLFR